MSEPGASPVAQAFLAESRRKLSACHERIRHCLDQLHDSQLWWRPHPSMNSIANLVLHLCGNLHQWIVSGVGGAADVRDRPAEFVDTGPVTKEQLIERIDRAEGEVDATLASFDPSGLPERRRIQGFDVVLLHAILDTASHFVGHTHQIVYITRVRMGGAYRFEWAPATAEQGAGTPGSKT